MSTTTVNEKDPRVVEADVAIAQANARKAAAEAVAAEVGAATPAMPGALTAQKVDVPDVPGPLATLAAYNALDAVAREIAGAVTGAVAGDVWIVPDAQPLEAVATMSTLLRDAERLIGFADEATVALQGSGPAPDPAPDDAIDGRTFAPGALTAASVAASAIPFVVSLFATDHTVRSGELSIGFGAAAAALAGKIRAVEPGRHVGVAGVGRGPGDAVAERITALQAARDRLATAVAGAEPSTLVSPDESVASARQEAWRSCVAELAKAGKDVTPMIGELGDAAREAAAAKAQRDQIARRVEHGRELVRLADELTTRMDEARRAVTVPDGCHVVVLQPLFSSGEAVFDIRTIGKAPALYAGAVVVAWYLLADGLELVGSGVVRATANATTALGRTDVTWLPAREVKEPFGLPDDADEGWHLPWTH